MGLDSVRGALRMLGADGLWNLAFGFLISLRAISSRFESGENTPELDAGLGIVEDSTTFSKKAAINCLRCCGSAQLEGVGGAYVRTCVCLG